MASNYLKIQLNNCHLRKPQIKYAFFILFMLLNISLYAQVEVCNNNRDDDNDGFIDCADPDCGCIANTFPCDSKMYMVRANPSDNNATNIEELSIVGNIPTLTTLYTKPLILNGLAYFNGHLYVMSSGKDTLYRIDKLGNVVNLGKVANLPIPNTQWSGATCDRDGNFYIIEGVASPNFRMYKIPLLPGGTYTATQIVGTGAGGAIALPNNPADIAIDENGVMFAFIQADLNVTTANSGLYTINLSNGAPTKVGTSSFSGISMGSLFAGDDGRMYAYGCNNQTTGFNQNTVYEVNKTNSAVTALTSTGTSVGRSDGCSCPWRVTLQRASPTVCTYPNGYFNWDFTLRNQTGAVLNNITFSDTLDIRFSYNFNVATTQATYQGIFGAGVTIAVTSFGGGVSNVVTITGMNVPLNTTTFSLSTFIPSTSVFTLNEIVYEQAFLKNLPSFRGTFESSDYPATTGPNNDASPVTIKISQVRITAGTNATICTGQTVSFTAANAGAGATYAWNFGTGATPPTSSSIGPVVVTYNTAGTQTATLSVTSNGCTGIITTPVNVNSTPTATVINQTICTGGTAILTATVSGGSGTTNYQWQESTNNSTWGNVVGGSGATTIAYTTPALTANKYYRVIVRSSPSNCTSTSASALISIVADPTITVATTAGIVCNGGSITLNATSNGGTGTCTIQWQSSPTVTNWTDISGQTSATYTTPNLSTPLKYRAKITCSGNGCCN
jgi:PKD domain